MYYMPNGAVNVEQRAGYIDLCHRDWKHYFDAFDAKKDEMEVILNVGAEVDAENGEVKNKQRASMDDVIAALENELLGKSMGEASLDLEAEAAAREDGDLVAVLQASKNVVLRPPTLHLRYGMLMEYRHQEHVTDDDIAREGATTTSRGGRHYDLYLREGDADDEGGDATGVTIDADADADHSMVDIDEDGASAVNGGAATARIRITK